MKRRYIVVESGPGFGQSDWQIIEAADARAALAAWDAEYPYRRADHATVAEVKLEAAGGR